VLAALALVVTVSAGVGAAAPGQVPVAEAIPQASVPLEAVAPAAGPSDVGSPGALPITLYTLAIVFLGVLPLTVHALKAYAYAQTIGPQLVTGPLCDRLSADEVRALVAALRHSAPGTEGLIRSAIVVPAISILGIGLLHVITTRTAAGADAFTVGGLLATILAAVVVGCCRRARTPTPVDAPFVSASD
jgi:hypothetical protein